MASADLFGRALPPADIADLPMTLRDPSVESRPNRHYRDNIEKPMEAKMTKSAQQLRGGTSNRCAVCGGKLRGERLSAARQDSAGEPQPIRHELSAPRDPLLGGALTVFSSLAGGN